jgi:uncharacterized membrane protein
MEMGDVRDLVIVLMTLLGFGAVYNQLVAWLENQEGEEGYTAFLVVGGTLVTLAGAAVLVGLEAALVVLACFAASGTPMVLGSAWRYIQERQKDRDLAVEITAEILRDDKA